MEAVYHNGDVVDVDHDTDDGDDDNDNDDGEIICEPDHCAQ